MKRIVLANLITLLLTSCAHLPVYDAKHTSPEEQVDHLRFYDSESHMQFDLYQDSTHLYLKLITGDFASQIKILKLGLTIYLDDSDKKKENKSITFPQGMDADQMQLEMKREAGYKNAMAMLHNRYLLSTKTMLLKGFDGKGSEKIVLANIKNFPINIRIDFDAANQLIYLASISKEMLKKDNPDIDYLSIGVVSGKMDPSRMGQARGGGGMGRGQGGGRGGMKGQSRGQNMQAPSALMNPIKIWFKTKI